MQSRLRDVATPFGILYAKKRRRNFALAWIFAAALLVLSAWLYYQFYEDSDRRSEIHTIQLIVDGATSPVFS